MAAPNIVNVSTIYGNTATMNVTTVASNVLVNAASSGQLYKIYSLHLCNYTASSVTANVFYNNGTSNYLVGNITIPANSTLIPISKDNGLYMQEGNYISASTSANASVWAICSYEAIS